MDYIELRRFSRAALAVRRAADRWGCGGSIHRESSKVGTLGQQLAKVGIFLDSRRLEPDAQRDVLWGFSGSVVSPDEENHQ